MKLLHQNSDARQQIHRTKAASTTTEIQHPVLRIQQVVGNQAVIKALSTRIQPKLKGGNSNDLYEQEADRIAAWIMTMPNPENVAKLDAVEEEELIAVQRIQRKETNNQHYELNPKLESQINDLRYGGQPLPQSVRGFFEPRFGYDFSQVRLHSGGLAVETTNALNSRAYTIGNDIVLGAGQGDFNSSKGKMLLAHELTHVIQQNCNANIGKRVVTVTNSSADLIRRQTPDPRHVRGYAGEQGMGFQLYPNSDGWIFIEGPSGSSGHGVTNPGFDGVAYNTKTDELHLIDNKSLKRSVNVNSATAIDPTRNLSRNLDKLIKHLETIKDLPGRIRVLDLLRQTKNVMINNQSLPSNVKLVVTGVGGQSSGVSARLESLGVVFNAGSSFKSAVKTTPTPTLKVTSSPKNRLH